MVLSGIGVLLQRVSAGGVYFQVRDVGPYSLDGAGTEKLSAQGHATAHWMEAKAAGGGELGLYSSGGGNDGSGLQGDWVLHHEEAEYGRAIYCDATDSASS